MNLTGQAKNKASGNSQANLKSPKTKIKMTLPQPPHLSFWFKVFLDI